MVCHAKRPDFFNALKVRTSPSTLQRMLARFIRWCTLLAASTTPDPIVWPSNLHSACGACACGKT